MKKEARDIPGTSLQRQEQGWCLAHGVICHGAARSKVPQAMLKVGEVYISFFEPGCMLQVA